MGTVGSQQEPELPVAVTVPTAQPMMQVSDLGGILTTLGRCCKPMPGDEILTDPSGTTRAISIGAAPEQVWPWNAQMGSGRAGWYSWDAIDNGGLNGGRN